MLPGKGKPPGGSNGPELLTTCYTQKSPHWAKMRAWMRIPARIMSIVLVQWGDKSYFRRDLEGNAIEMRSHFPVSLKGGAGREAAG